MKSAEWVAIKRRTLICLAITAIVVICIVSYSYIQPTGACYGPCITANIDRTQLDINQTVTITGQICPPAENASVRVVFERPDYTYIEKYTLTDPESGNFTITQTLDQAGYWNIFTINGACCDRLFAVVTDPANPNEPPPTPAVPVNTKIEYNVLYPAVAVLGVAAVLAVWSWRNKTKNISSLRLLVQVCLLFLIFFGAFTSTTFPVPATEISPHEVLAANNVLGVSMPDGLPAPFLACYYPCGRTVTCALWQIQTYIYPFFNVGSGWGVHYTSAGILRLAVVFGIIILAAVILGRLFCGWVCPFGLYVDVIARIRKALRIRRRKLSDKTSKQLHQLSFIILAAAIMLSVIFGSAAIAGAQLLPGTQKGGYVWEYFSSPFCQVCPMKPFCILVYTGIGLMLPSWVTQTTAGKFFQVGFYLTSINIIILILVTAAAFFFSRSWCKICPLGALTAVFNRFPPFKGVSGVRLNKQEEKCKKCGICKRVCPMQTTDVYEKKGGDVAGSQCIWCLRCVEMCPYDGCLQFKFAGQTICKSRNWLGKLDNVKED